MDILNNPFFILGVSVFDSQSKLTAIAQKKSQTLNKKLVQQSIQILTDPKLRVQAEIAWIYNFSYSVLNKQLQQKLANYQKSQGVSNFVPYSSVDPVDLFRGYPCAIKQLKEIFAISWPSYNALYGAAPNGLGALSAVNILLPLFRYNWKPSSMDPMLNKPADLIVTIVHAFDEINLGAVGELINQTRKQAQFPPVSMPDLQQAFERHRRFVLQTLLDFFDKLPSIALPEYLSNLELVITDHGRSHMSSKLLSDLLGAYESQIATFFTSQKETLRRSLNFWAVSENEQLPDPQVLYYVNACVKQSRAWMQVLKPLNTWVHLQAASHVARAQVIQEPERRQAYMQRIHYHHTREDELFALLRNYLSYIPHLGSEVVRYNVLDSFRKVFSSDPVMEAAFMQLTNELKSIEHAELKELQAGLESPDICNFMVNAPLPEGVDAEENRVILTIKTIEFQQQLLSVNRILSFWVEKQDDMWVVYVVFEHGLQWKLPFEECLTAFVLAHQLSMVLLEYKFSIWMNRLRNQIPVSFSPIVVKASQDKALDGSVATLNLWNDGIELQILPNNVPLSKDSEPKLKIERLAWHKLDLKRIAQEMSWSMLKIYLKDNNALYYELKYGVPNFRLLCCLFMAIQDSQNNLLTEYVKGASSEVSEG